MECSNLIESAIKSGDISTGLFRGSRNKELVTDLQRTLFELGFRKQLKWDKYQADGGYGAATTAAVAEFAKRNRFQSDGTFVSNDLVKIMLQRHDFLPSMYLLSEIHTSDLRSRKWISKGTKMSIIAVQVLLNELGYGKLQEDGIYEKNLKEAVITFASDNNIPNSDGDLLTRPLIDLLLKEINIFYGDKWSDQAANNLPNNNSPLKLYQGSQFVGKPCRADVEFLPMLDKINAYASQANVLIHITNSFRTTTNVQGAIVKPATFSNHLAGHGIDMNVIYDNGKWANSKVLVQYPNVPAPVAQFLKSIIDDPKLRWGGLFNTTDPVHIDDWLNKDMVKWRARYEAMQRAVQLGEV